MHKLIGGVHAIEVAEVFVVIVPDALPKVYLMVWVKAVAYLVIDMVSGEPIYPLVAATTLFAGSTTREYV